MAGDGMRRESLRRISLSFMPSPSSEDGTTVRLYVPLVTCGGMISSHRNSRVRGRGRPRVGRPDATVGFGLRWHALAAARFEPLENRCAAEEPLAIAVLSCSNRYEPARSGASLSRFAGTSDDFGSRTGNAPGGTR